MCLAIYESCSLKDFIWVRVGKNLFDQIGDLKFNKMTQNVALLW